MNKSLRWIVTCAATGLVVLATHDCPAGEETGDVTSAPPAQTPDQEADREALRALLPVYEQAANEGKLKPLEPYLDEEFSGVMVTGKEVDSFQSLEAYWEEIQGLIGEGGTYHAQVHLAGPAALTADIAVAHGTTDEEVVTATGDRFNYQGRWTAVCRKREGEWKILRIHGSMDPVNNPFVSAMARGSSFLFGLAGLVGGLVLGLVIGWLARLLIARRRAPASD